MYFYKKKKKKVKRPKYPDFKKSRLKIFRIKYDKNLSSTAKLVLNSFSEKFIYYAIDDILYREELDSIEKKNLLTILYSSISSLHNNFSINFLDIWVWDIYIEEIPKTNKFFSNDFKIFEQGSLITIQLLYKIPIPVKKQEPLW